MTDYLRGMTENAAVLSGLEIRKENEERKLKLHRDISSACDERIVKLLMKHVVGCIPSAWIRYGNIHYNRFEFQLDMVVRSERFRSDDCNRPVHVVPGGAVNFSNPQLFPVQRKLSISWQQRAAIVFFYLHDELGRMDMPMTLNIFEVNHCT